MCGYVRRDISNKRIQAFLEKVGLGGVRVNVPEPQQLQHFYPAFGGAVSRRLEGLIIREDGVNKAVDATWWFDCQEEEDSLRVNNTRTTLNARNLTSPYWKGAIRHHRGIFVATGLGEGKVVDGKNRHYLVESDEPILMGCVYRPFSNGCYSAATITRDSHPRFEQYHDKAFPLMLPNDPEFIDLWLSDAREDDSVIAGLLAHPAIFNELKITQVKTLKDGKALNEPELLMPD